MSNITSIKPRINRFDNLKGLAIILIVLGHMLFITQYTTDILLKKTIFIFHLSIFFFVAGYFSKIGPKEPMKAVKRLLIPYLLFCIIYKIFLYFIIGESSDILFLVPEYALWFLIALFFMKLLLPLLNKLKYPITLTVILALIIGVIPLNLAYLSISRCIAFLPAFLVGFKYKEYKKIFDKKYPKLNEILNNNKVAFCLLIISLIICVLIAYTTSSVSIELKSQYFFKSNIGVMEEIVRRFLIIIMGIIVTLLLNKLMTNNQTFLTKIGRNSMTIYLLHVYFITSIKTFIIPNVPLSSSGGLIFLVFALVSTGIIVLLLSRDVVTKYLNKIIDGTYELIIRMTNIIIKR